MAAGSIAQLASGPNAAEVYYLILTDGCQGTSNREMTPEKLVKIRQEEQRAAAREIGVKDVFFLDYKDGALEVTLQLKKDIVRVIRQLKPDVVFAMDPTMVYSAKRNFVNHPDHRAGGQAAMDAVFPLARDHLSFPDLMEAGFQPHKVRTLLLTNFNVPDYCIDITGTLGLKLAALGAHASQITDMEKTAATVRKWAEEDGKLAGCVHAEGFVRLDID